MKKIGFIGLGTMGYHMAGHLAASGENVLVYNRTTSRASQWAEENNGQVCTSVKALAHSCDIIFTCLGNDDDVREIYFGDEGILVNARAGAVLVDHTTTSATLAKEIYRESFHRTLGFLDAPVSGGEAGAINGQLAVMVGGDKTVLDPILAVINSFSKSVTHLGDSGSGQLCKMANQVCIAGVLQGLSEAIVLAEAAGLNIDLVKQAISGGAAGSWQLSNRMQTMHQREFDFGFAIDWMRKDLAFCLDEAKRHNLNLYCAKHVDQEYEKLQALGENRLDTSVLVKQFSNNTYSESYKAVI